MIESSDFRTLRMPLRHGAGHMPALGFGALIPDAAILALWIGCRLRRAELVSLAVEDLPIVDKLDRGGNSWPRKASASRPSTALSP